MDNNPNNKSEKSEEVISVVTKPRSRLLVMKDRLKSQRKFNNTGIDKNSGNTGKSEEKSGGSKKTSKLSKSHSFTEADKPHTGAKKSLFGGGKHKKAQSAEMELNGGVGQNYQSETYTTAAAVKSTNTPLNKNITASGKNKKGSSDPLRFFTSSSLKMPKSKSFDLDVAPLDESGDGLKGKSDHHHKKSPGRLNKSLEVESSRTGGSTTSGIIATDKNSSTSAILKAVSNDASVFQGDKATGQSNSNSGRSIRSAIGSHFGFGFHGNSSKSTKSPAKENKKQQEKTEIKYQIHRKIDSHPGGKKSGSSVQYTLKPKIKSEAPLVNPDSSSGSEGGFESQQKVDTQKQEAKQQIEPSPSKSQQQQQPQPDWKGSSEYLDRSLNSARTEPNSLSLAVAVSTLPRTGRVPLPKAQPSSAGFSHQGEKSTGETVNENRERSHIVEPSRNTMAAFHGRSISAERKLQSSPVLQKSQPQERAPYLKMDFRDAGADVHGGHHTSKSLSPERVGYHSAKSIAARSGLTQQYSEGTAVRTNTLSSSLANKNIPQEGQRHDFPEKRNVNLAARVPPPPTYEKVLHIRDGPYDKVPGVTGETTTNQIHSVPRSVRWGDGVYTEVPKNVQPRDCLADNGPPPYSRVPPIKTEEFSKPASSKEPGHGGYYSGTGTYQGEDLPRYNRHVHVNNGKEPVYYRQRLNQTGDQTNRNSAIYHSSLTRPKPIIRQSQSLEDLLDSDSNGKYNPNLGRPDPYHRPNSKESVSSNSTSQTSYDNYPSRTRGPYTSDYRVPRDNSCPPALDYQRIEYQNNNSERGMYGQRFQGNANNKRNLQLTDVVKPQGSDRLDRKPSSHYSAVDNKASSHYSAVDNKASSHYSAVDNKASSHYSAVDNKALSHYSAVDNKASSHYSALDNKASSHYSAVDNKASLHYSVADKQSSQYSGLNNNNTSFSSSSDVSQYQDRIDALKNEFKNHFEDNNNELPCKTKDFSDLSNKLDAHIIMNENEGVYHVRKELGNIPDVARTGPSAFEKQSSNYEYLNKLNRDNSNVDRGGGDRDYMGVYSVRSAEPRVIPYSRSDRDHPDYVSSAEIQAQKAACGDYAVLYDGRILPESNYVSVEDVKKKQKVAHSGVSSSTGNGVHLRNSGSSSDPRLQQPSRVNQGYGEYTVGKASRLERISEGDYDTLKERHLDKISEGSQECVAVVEPKRKIEEVPKQTKPEVSTPPSKRPGLKVTNPEDLKSGGQAGSRGTPNGLRGSVLRRHTVTTGQAEQEFQSMRRDGDQVTYSRHPHAVQTRNESYYEAVKEEDRISTKSESESPAHSAFTRGGRLRSSLPIVRSPNKSLDKPMGLVFLIYRHETKRSLLPNEVTSLDTIRALFVRAFCDQLSMRWFDGTGRKIYVMDPGTNVYYELEDLRDIKDRSVLKIYEPDFPFNIRSPSLSPHPREAMGNHHGYESDSSVRSAPPMVPRSPMHQSHPPPSHRTYVQEVNSKTASLPVQSNYAYHGPKVPQQQPPQHGGNNPATHNGSGPSSQGPAGWGGSPTHTSHPRMHHGAGSPTAAAQGSRSSMGGSPTTHRPLSQHVSPLARNNPAALGSPLRSPVHQNNRHSVAYLPPNAADFQSNQLPQSQSYHDYQDQRSSGSVTPSVEDSETRERMQRMEAQLASLTAMVQSAVVLKGGEGGSRPTSRPGSARSNCSLVSESSCSVKSMGTGLTDSISDSTTSTLHSPSLSSYQGISDSSTATPQPFVSVDMQNNMRALYQRARELRTEVNKLRKLQQANNENMQETIYETFKKIKVIIEKVPGAEDQPVRHQRQEVNQHLYSYQDEATRVERDLSDLALSVDDLRQDVLTKGCRINKDEIQTMALTLSHISKSLGDLKCKFPHLQQNVKSVLAGEMEVVVKEEKFLQREPDNLDEQLKKCEKIMKVLLTLKRLGNVQDAKPVVQPTVLTQRSPTLEDRRRILDNIEAMAPNHGTRAASVEAAEAARERKKKISSNAESLRFEKALDQAQKQLRTTNLPATGATEPADKTNGTQQQARPHLQELELNGAGESAGVTKSDSPSSPNLPLTDTTKRLSKINKGKESLSDAGGGGESHGRKTSDTSDIAVDRPENRLKPDKVNTGIVNSQDQAGVSPSQNVLNANTSGSSIQSQVSRLSTFGLPGMTSTPNGENAQSLPQGQQQRNEKSASSANNTSQTSNNGSSARVSFCSTVTEIQSPSCPSQDSGAARQRKVPPPPPPRKSSRSTMLSPSGNKMMLRLRPPQSESPPTYENIENFPNKGQTKNNPPNSSKHPGSPPSRIPQAGQAKSPMTRYQHELASGIYANMNRPDLQEQKIKPMEAVKTASLDKGSDEEGSSESQSSSEESQGTVKRRPASKETSPQPINSENADNQSKQSVSNKTEDIYQSKDSRKLPPPPPVRKTSALSQNATEIQTGQSGAGNSAPAKLSPDGASKIPKISGGFSQKKLSNGDVKSGKSARDRQYNETEIY